jgi:hypothetical protein
MWHYWQVSTGALASPLVSQDQAKNTRAELSLKEDKKLELITHT